MRIFCIKICNFYCWCCSNLLILMLYVLGRLFSPAHYFLDLKMKCSKMVGNLKRCLMLFTEYLSVFFCFTFDDLLRSSIRSTLSSKFTLIHLAFGFWPFFEDDISSLSFVCNAYKIFSKFQSHKIDFVQNNFVKLHSQGQF